MGRVRQKYIKNIAASLVEQSPKTFTKDFDHNKQVLREMPEFSSKLLRNRVAGYIVRVVSQEKL